VVMNALPTCTRECLYALRSPSLFKNRSAVGPRGVGFARVTFRNFVSRNPEAELQSSLTVGQRLADRVANIGGSWKFITWFMFVFVIWILTNSVFLVARPFDPYPFIFLNLVLSCLAAAQAPVIMMSQNRQEARDRLHAARDYQINLKAELEIRHLHQKMDHLLSHQWERLMEIQEIQMELINEVRAR
jgi:uncharacterized membrane protein